MEQIGWGRNIEAAAIPDGARGERKVVREDGAAVVDPVPVGVFQHPDMVIRLGRHLGGGERVARRLTEEKASAVVESQTMPALRLITPAEIRGASATMIDVA